jgi:hypothetical protein
MSHAKRERDSIHFIHFGALHLAAFCCIRSTTIIAATRLSPSCFCCHSNLPQSNPLLRNNSDNLRGPKRIPKTSPTTCVGQNRFRKRPRRSAWTKTDSENLPDNLQESKKIRKSHFTGCDVTIQNRKTHFTTCRSQNRFGKATLQVVMWQFGIGKATLQPTGAKIESEKPLYRLLWGISESERSPDNLWRLKTDSESSPNNLWRSKTDSESSPDKLRGTETDSRNWPDNLWR